MLAAYAIDKFHLSEKFCRLNILNVDFETFDGIPMKYAGPLLRNMTLFRPESGDTDWRQVSHNLFSLEDVSHSNFDKLCLTEGESWRTHPNPRAPALS
jgi:hypothetical protein